LPKNDGGAIYLTSSSMNGAGLIIDGANSTSQGGGIFAIQSPITIANSHLNNCYSYFGAGVYLENSQIDLINCDVTLNDAVQGGGIFCIDGRVDFSDTFVNKNVGGNLHCDSCAVFDNQNQCTCKACN